MRSRRIDGDEALRVVLLTHRHGPRHWNARVLAGTRNPGTPVTAVEYPQLPGAECELNERQCVPEVRNLEKEMIVRSRGRAEDPSPSDSSSLPRLPHLSI